MGAVQAEPITKKQAINQAQAQESGKVLKATLAEKGDTLVYRVKILKKDGRVKTVTIPAEK